MTSILDMNPKTFVVRGKQTLSVPEGVDELVFDALVLVSGSQLIVKLPKFQKNLNIRCSRIFSVAEGATLEISSPNGTNGGHGTYVLHDLIFFKEAKEKIKAHPSPPWIKRDKKKSDQYIPMPGNFMNRQGPFPRSRVEFRTNPTNGGAGHQAPHLQIFSSRVLLDSAKISVRGGNGGIGGNGPQGWKGKNGGGRWGGGGSDGLKGGAGAKGGSGGAGGEITVWAGSISSGASLVLSDVIGGQPGKGGNGGNGGDPGNKRRGRSQKNVRGPNGATGKKGSHGKPGKASIVYRSLAKLDPKSMEAGDMLRLAQTLAPNEEGYTPLDLTKIVETVERLKTDSAFLEQLEQYDEIATNE